MARLMTSRQTHSREPRCIGSPIRWEGSRGAKTRAMTCVAPPPLRESSQTATVSHVRSAGRGPAARAPISHHAPMRPSIRTHPDADRSTPAMLVGAHAHGRPAKAATRTRNPLTSRCK